MVSALELSNSYRTSRKWVMLISWLGILWASATLNITKISLPYINEIIVSDKAIPLITLLALVFNVVVMHNEYAMMSIRVRRNSLAIFDFKLFLYLSKIAIAALAVSIEVRSVKQIVYFIMSFLPVMFVTVLIGAVLGFLLVGIGTYFRKSSRGFAAWVIAMFSLGSLLAVVLVVISVILVALGLTFFDDVKSYFGVEPTTLGIWSVAMVAILLIIQQYLEESYTNMLFGFEYYNPKTNVKKYFNKDGQLTQVVENYKANYRKTNALHLIRTSNNESMGSDSIDS